MQRAYGADQRRGGHSFRQQRSARGHVRAAPRNARHAEASKPELIGQRAHVVGPVGERSVLLVIGQPESRPVRGDDPQAQTPRGFIDEPKHEPRAGRAVKSAKWYPQRVAELRVAQPPPIGQTKKTVFARFGVAGFKPAFRR